jgi:predicted ATPase
MAAPFITHITRNRSVFLDQADFPGNLPFVQDIQLEFRDPVTFLVGENGSGKSTLLEAIAVLAGLPISGGGTNEVGAFHGLHEESRLADALRLGFKRRPRDGYFFRAELQAHFASLLDARRSDPDFNGNPYARYGGLPLHGMSHGEAFLSVMSNRFAGGLFLLDEPETALSPQRQLTLLALMYDLARAGNTQFLVATHSPILLTYPAARIVSFDDAALPTVSLMDTQHYQITNGILCNPEAYWRHLRDPQ